MTRFRKWILAVGITVALTLPLGMVASADPSDPGTTFSSTSSTSRGPGRSTMSDPSDPGTGW